LNRYHDIFLQPVRLKREDDLSSTRLQDSGRQQVNKILPDNSGIRRGCGWLSQPPPRATGPAEFKRTVAGFLAPQDWQLLYFKTVLPASPGSTVCCMETSIKKANAGHPRSSRRAPATSPIMTTPSAFDHPSFLFERLLDAG